MAAYCCEIPLTTVVGPIGLTAIESKLAGTTVKFVSEVAVTPPTVTDIGPVVAPEGTVTTSVFAVADLTVAGVPLNRTALALAVGLKPESCPLRLSQHHS